MLEESRIELLQMILAEYPRGSELVAGLTASREAFLRVEFQVALPDELPDGSIATLSFSENRPYTLTGDEQVNYGRKWREIRSVCRRHGHPDPFASISLGPLPEDPTVNLPNAFHLLSGFFAHLTELEHLAPARDITVPHIGWSPTEGPGSHDRPLVRELSILTGAFYRGLYFGDAPPCPGRGVGE